ncbi:MAG: response regulator transcription factor [Spirochaetes bacterium]|nr:response regulator transcription factor [Spirochaetota bacterium]
MANIVVVEDQPIIQQRLVDLFAANNRYTLRALCPSAESALARLGESPCDLLLVDLELPGMNGEELIPFVRDRFPEIKVVVFTVFEDQARIVRLMKLGIAGYILKDTNETLFLAELDVILLGGATLSTRVARKILDENKSTDASESPLTDRETEILNLTALGMTYRDIAEELDISPNTVRVHIAHIYEKLCVQSKTQALNRARQMGILE